MFAGAYAVLEQAGFAATVLLINGWWQSMALTAVLWLVLRLWNGNRTNAATRYALWCAALLGIVCLPLLNGVGAQFIQREEAATRVGVSVLGETKWGNGVVSQESPPVVAVSQSKQFAPEGNPWSISLPAGSWPAWVLGLWGLGALLLSWRLGRGWLYARRLKAASRALPLFYRRQFADWNRPNRLRRRIAVGSSSQIAAPVVVGFLRPAVLLPAAMVGRLHRQEFKQIALHELAHLRRCDDWTRLFQELVSICCWPLPAVWWIGRQLDLQREIACDDCVVAQTGQSQAYAHCLTRLIELSLWSRQPALAIGIAEGKSQIAVRVGLLLDRARETSPRLSRPGVLAGSCLIGLSLLFLGACANPFAPVRHIPTDPGQVVAPATRPEILFDNLHQAMRGRDRDLYESLIDDQFWFTEFDCQGDLVLANDRERELMILGDREGTSQGVFDFFREFQFDFSLIRRSQELGPEHPFAFNGDPDGHPHEDWQVYRGRVQMLMLDDVGDGFRVDQVMTFKLRQGDEGLWKIIRWDDDPIAGDCGGPVASAE